jgi:hypothetical protein
MIFSFRLPKIIRVSPNRYIWLLYLFYLVVISSLYPLIKLSFILFDCQKWNVVSILSMLTLCSVGFITLINSRLEIMRFFSFSALIHIVIIKHTKMCCHKFRCFHKDWIILLVAYLFAIQSVGYFKFIFFCLSCSASKCACYWLYNNVFAGWLVLRNISHGFSS